MNVRGAQRRPIMKEREKFRVARVERKRPRRRREKDLIRRYCWGIGVEGGCRGSRGRVCDSRWDQIDSDRHGGGGGVY